MGRKFSVSYEERIDAIEKYLRHENSLTHLAKQLKVSYWAVKRWLITYQSLGPEGLIETSKNMHYSPTLKEAAVMDYLAGTVLTEIFAKNTGLNQPVNCKTGFQSIMVMRS
ncbi:trp repressor/replication initiator [Lucifera butyrica]|uniref:Trp repressor/replication initiator n=1 Tax=Lucifera butyrica TaxID=1351585 RepID=A0A498RHR8_9FIRM|nr:helix-turn-helix domain-containing protein [Lucifera butyrica]VBB09632.1 trp repressor/replication initiator [Lucifera butyrica]